MGVRAAVALAHILSVTYRIVIRHTRSVRFRVVHPVHPGLDIVSFRHRNQVMVHRRTENIQDRHQHLTEFLPILR